MKSISFGSCLSRYVLNNYRQLYGARILNSVYHNRSDQFVGYYIESKWNFPDRDAITSNVIKEVSTNLENDPLNIIENQYPNGVGRHDLPRGRSLWHNLEHERVDLFLFDNFMDISAKLFVFNDPQVGPLFLRLKDFPSDYSNFFSFCDYISTEESIVAFDKIIRFFKEIQPQAHFFFLHFPYDTYGHNLGRVKRSKEFAASFQRHPLVTVLPPMQINKKLRTESPSHFARPIYASLAGAIHYAITQAS